ncbi:MAG TPA: hypothetical protein VIF15_19050 [Polyangiaceae bacterium]
MRMRRRWLFASLTLAVIAAAACGSRTGLLVPLDLDGGDASSDAFHRHDVFTLDAPDEDVLPPIDVTPPRDVLNDCPDAGSTLVYVITNSGTLMSFYPPSATFRSIGTISCPTSGPTDQPFSMAVDRTGVAYIVFQNPGSTSLGGELFRVSTLTAACAPTGFVRGQSGFSNTFGMGFSHDTVGTGETLYVASDALGSQTPRLASIDTNTFKLTIIGDMANNMAELTGTGAGDLFAFYGIGSNTATDSAIGQLDKTTGSTIAESVLTGVTQGTGWAFAFWGGDFYTFTAPNGAGSIVTRFRPADGSIVQVASTSEVIVGAGVSTCAPQQ